MGTMMSIVTAIMISLRIVPIPGISLIGIHRNNTPTLTAKVDCPTVIPVIIEIPSAKTVQGVFPISAEINRASPTPNMNSPRIKIDRVENFGFIDIGLSELHQVFGTDLAGFRIFPTFILSSSYSSTHLMYSFVEEDNQKVTSGVS